MPLAAGTRLGPYEIVGAIGAGGMGEVYRARDTKLKRDAAVKVLPEAFALDPERVARFQREAEVLASLNHPNIAQIHGVEETAEVLKVSPDTVMRDWRAAKTWLHRELGRGAAPGRQANDS
jgi:serine/threonine protein kinase